MPCIALDAAVRYRFTRTNVCCAPVCGPGNSIVTDALTELSFSANTEEVGREAVRNTAGNICLEGNQRDELINYGVDLTFCKVIPCLHDMMTGNDPVLDWKGDVVGWRSGTGRTDLGGFAMEVWFTAGGSTDICDPTDEEGTFLYLAVPCITQATMGDFTVTGDEATLFPMTATTKSGEQWCRGPYPVVPQDASGTPGPLVDPLGPGDHLYWTLTSVPPPPVSPDCDCEDLAECDLGCESPTSPTSPALAA